MNKFESPRVFLLAETRLSWGIPEFLEAVGAGNWASNALTSAEKLIELAGRVCYRSWYPGANRNVTRVRTDNKDYLENILRSKHGQLLEHATVTFGFVGLSRVCTHEIVRHRAGAAYSQESLRYVYPFPARYRIPQTLSPDKKDKFRKAIERIEEIVKDFADSLFPPHEQKTFAEKKKDTSILRRLMPQGMTTVLVATFNHRALRHIIEQRTSVHAEEEIREVFSQVAEICKREWPNLYQDMNRNKQGEWVFEHQKV